MTKPILIIEDDRDIADILRYSLENRRFETRLAATGDEGLAASLDKINPPALILMDLLLPGMNGIEICRQVRREQSTENIPIIMITAKASEIDFARAREVGVNDYIIKPFSVRNLIERIDVLLKQAGGSNSSE